MGSNVASVTASTDHHHGKFFTVMKGAVGMGGIAILAIGAFAPTLGNAAVAAIAGGVVLVGLVAGHLVVTLP